MKQIINKNFIGTKIQWNTKRDYLRFVTHIPQVCIQLLRFMQTKINTTALKTIYCTILQRTTQPNMHCRKRCTSAQAVRLLL